MERHILREGTFYCPISSSGNQGVPSRIVRDVRIASDGLPIPGSTLDSLHSV